MFGTAVPITKLFTLLCSMTVGLSVCPWPPQLFAAQETAESAVQRLVNTIGGGVTHKARAYPRDSLPRGVDSSVFKILTLLEMRFLSNCVKMKAQLWEMST